MTTNPTAPSPPDAVERVIEFLSTCGDCDIEAGVGAIFGHGSDEKILRFKAGISDAITSRPAPSAEMPTAEILDQQHAVGFRDGFQACLEQNRVLAEATSPALDPKYPSPKDDFSERNDPFALDPKTVETCARKLDEWAYPHAAAAIRALVPPSPSSKPQDHD